MKHSIFPLILLLAACSSDPKTTPMPVADIAVPAYPETRKDTSVIDRYFGTEVADPYRWLENDTSEETGAWVKVQNEATYSYLDQLPDRERIKERLAEIWNYERYSTPYKKGPYYIFYKNDGVQNQSVVYLQEGLEGTPRVLIDPNQFSEDGTTALGTLSLSKDAKYAAYSVSVAGSDWQEIRVMEVATGKVLDDVIPWVKFSGISWFGDGFYYSRYDAPAGAEYSAKNEYHKVCYHRIGDDPAEDGIVFEDRDHPQRNFYAQTTEDEQYLIVYGAESTSGNSLQFRNLAEDGSDWQVIDPNFEQEYRVIDHADGRFLLHTNHSAPKNRVVAVDPANPTPENWTELIAEQEHVLEGITLANGKMVSQYLVDVSNRLYVHDMNGKQEGEIALPGLGIIGGFNADKDSPTAFYSFTNYTTPGTIYRYEMTTDSAVVFQQPNIDFNPEDYETHQVFFTSKDGTKVPMFITHKKGLKMDGNNPTFLYGYGGFNIAIKPSFRIERTVFLEQGGIYAVANIRGGSEYGEDWHQQGTQLQKQNVFDDFIAAAEYLINEKYTSSDKLAIHGRSNGGLLIGAVMTQRPDLFKVAIPKVGVLDMLRYHKFTIGWAWATDYGTSDDSTQFPNLLGYSPVHNVTDQAYPATLVVTGDHDDRVVPAHSFKFIAQLQDKHNGPLPVLIRIDTDGGHGAGKPVSMQIDEFGDTWAFVFYHLGLRMPPAGS